MVLEKSFGRPGSEELLVRHNNPVILLGEGDDTLRRKIKEAKNQN
jgi:hypothetical protein